MTLFLYTIWTYNFTLEGSILSILIDAYFKDAPIRNSSFCMQFSLQHHSPALFFFVGGNDVFEVCYVRESKNVVSVGDIELVVFALERKLIRLRDNNAFTLFSGWDSSSRGAVTDPLRSQIRCLNWSRLWGLFLSHHCRYVIKILLVRKR